jgi:hypothetical protein
MLRKIAIALVLVGIANPVRALTPDESLIPLPSTEKIDATKGNPSELIPIEKNSDFKLTQKENNEDYYIEIVNDYVDKKTI